MCGIAGVADFSWPTSAQPAVARRIINELNHRGPNNTAVWGQGPVAFGHARLSVIDLSSAADQPMTSPDGRYTITYNGEIFNFQTLRAELSRAGVESRTASDTEVILNGFAAWGEALFPKLNGIFAFAIWDHTQQQLVLARDRFGVKPLYVYSLRHGIVFASEIKGILASGAVQRGVDPQALHEFSYFGTALGGQTLFQGVRQLAPGHWLRVNEKESTEGAYWTIESVIDHQDDGAEAVSRVRCLFAAAVERQLVSDVPVGIFLSGGLDSSAIAAFSPPDARSQLTAYTAVFDYAGGVNELAKARSVASLLGIQHVPVTIAGWEVEDTVRRLVRCHDEPFSDAANIPIFLMCQQLEGRTRVILQGDGGDELFGGYRRYGVLSHFERWRSLAAIRRLIPARGGHSLRRLRRLLDALAVDEAGVRMAWLLTTDTPQLCLRNLLSPEWRSRLDETEPFRRYRQIAARMRGLDPVQLMLRTDLSIELPDVFLPKVDRASMAHGVEVRVPFLDNDLADYALGLRPAIKVSSSRPKNLLRHALAGRLPTESLAGPKVGFGVPYSYWLSSSLARFAEDTFESAGRRSDNFFDRQSLRALFTLHRSRPTEQTGFVLWKALNLAIWQQEYFA